MASELPLACQMSSFNTYHLAVPSKLFFALTHFSSSVADSYGSARSGIFHMLHDFPFLPPKEFPFWSNDSSHLDV